MKDLKDIILEKLIINKDINIKSNTTNIYDDVIGDHWKYDSWSTGRPDMKKIFPYIDKEYLKEHPCSQEELNYGVDNQKGEKSWIDVCKKCNKIAKIIETWPANIIPKKRSFHGTKIDSKELPGFINNLEITIHRYDKKFEIQIHDLDNNCITITFKRK